MNQNGRCATLGEGNTPLIRSAAVGAQLSLRNLHFKLETSNPTGSFKDRFAAAEVTRMLRCNRKVCLATSSGNTGSSLAAYCARYGIGFYLFVNEQTPQEKLLQARAHGARIHRVLGFGIDGLETQRTFDLLQEIAAAGGFDLLVSAYRYCPEGMDHLRLISREVVEQLRDTPDHVFVPVGGGGLLTAVWRGFLALHETGVVARLPRIHAVQPAGNPTVFDAWKARRTEVRPLLSTTQISGLSVPFDIDGSDALRAVYDSNGCALAPTDEEIWDAQRLLSQREGIYAEPAGATSLAGAIQGAHAGWLRPDETVVCLVTGHGFKDSDAVERMTDDGDVPLVAPEELASVELKEPAPLASYSGSPRRPEL